MGLLALEQRDGRKDSSSSSSSSSRHPMVHRPFTMAAILYSSRTYHSIRCRYRQQPSHLCHRLSSVRSPCLYSVPCLYYQLPHLCHLLRRIRACFPLARRLS